MEGRDREGEKGSLPDSVTCYLMINASVLDYFITDEVRMGFFCRTWRCLCMGV